MPMGALSGTATAKAALTKMARVEAENFMVAVWELDVCVGIGAWQVYR